MDINARCPGRRAALARAAACLVAPCIHSERGQAAEAAEGYLLGVVPYFSPSRLEEIYAPAAAELARALGRSVSFRTTSSWDRAYAQLKAQTYDIMLVHAMWYVAAADEFGYVPLARMSEPFTSIVVVPSASAIRTVQDLRGKRIAAPPYYLPAVHLAKKALRERGLVRGRDLEFEETRTVDACLQQALTGAAQACVAPPFAVYAYQASTGVRLRVLLESQELPSPVFVARGRFAEPERERIRAALLDWNRSPGGQAVLRSINTKALVPAHDQDFEPVRAFIRQLDEPWRPSAP